MLDVSLKHSPYLVIIEAYFRHLTISFEDVLLFPQAADIKLLGSLDREDLKKLCGDNYPEWISFPVYEQVSVSYLY